MTTTQQEIRPGHAGGDIRGELAHYRSFHDEAAGGTASARQESYEAMVRGYYDLVTDFYERGWGDSFHFAPRFRGEPFHCSMLRHQHYLAARLGIHAGMHVLDVGCGLGGPMRELARFSGAKITGVNNNGYQVIKADRYNRESGLDAQCTLLQADFMQIPRPVNHFDAIYAFGATCHAPDKTALLKELFRLLKPGGKLGIYEWCLTSKYQPDNPVHAAAKKGIEEGNGLPALASVAETQLAFKDAGFKLLEHEDRAAKGDPEVPWHYSLAGREWRQNLLSVHRTRAGRRAEWGLLKLLEAAKLAPQGTLEVSQFLHRGADALVVAGDAGCFTPMEFFLAQKPRRASASSG